MIKFPIYPQDNEPLLKTQTPFIFTHPSVGQRLRTFFHTIHCTAEVRTPQHTRYGTDTYKRHLRSAAFCWWTCIAGHFLYAWPTEGGESVQDHPRSFGTSEPTPRARVLNSEGPQSHSRWPTLNAWVVQWFSAGLIYQAEARWTSLWKRHPRHLTNSIPGTNLQ